MRKHLLSFICILLVILCALPALGETSEGAATVADVSYTLLSYDFEAGSIKNAALEDSQLFTVELSAKNNGQTAAELNPMATVLAISDKNRVYLPILIGENAKLPLTLAQGEELRFRMYYEVPAMEGDYRLILLDGSRGSIAGEISVGASRVTTFWPVDTSLLSFTASGLQGDVYGAYTIDRVGVTSAPEGMRFLVLDLLLSAEDTRFAFSNLVDKWILACDGTGEYLPVNPVRASGNLALLDAQLNQGFTQVRGNLYFLVPEDAAKITSITADKTIAAEIPLTKAADLGTFTGAIGNKTYVQGEWRVTIDKVETSAGTETVAPPEDAAFIAVYLTIENMGAKGLTISSQNAFALMDSDGYDLAQAWFTGNDTSETLDGVAMPGQPVSGAVSFILPNSQKADTFRVHLSMVGEPMRIPMADIMD